MGKYWFKPKRYGYGLYPVSLQGWVATLCLCVLILVSFYLNIHAHFIIGARPSLREWLRFGLDVIILSALFLVLFKDKTEGEIRWRWGRDKSDSPPRSY